MNFKVTTFSNLEGKMKILLVICGIFLMAFTTGDSKSYYNIPISPTSIYTDDFDLDGDKDIIIGHITGVGYTNPSLTILKNDGQGYFEVYDTAKTYFGAQYDIFSKKINGDNYPEIVTFLVYENSSRYIRILINDEGVFDEYQDFSLNQTEPFGHKTFGDANGDGLVDIIIASYGCQCWGILHNQGQGNFSEPEYFDVDYHPTDIKCGNLNNDEIDDIVIGGGDVNIYFPGDSGFEITTFDNGSWFVFIDDFDNDGDNDIIGIDGVYTWNYFSYMENTGNGNFIQHPDTTTHPGGLDFSLTDLDNDGLSEILCLANSFSGIYIFYNKGNFHLGEPEFIPVTYFGEDSRRFHCDDLDNNGFNDIIIVRRHGSPLTANLTILFNDGQGNFVEDPIISTQTSNFEPQTSNLSCNPNPFKTETSISFTTMTSEITRLQIFDLNGNLINSLVNDNLLIDKYTVKWNGRDKNGKEVNTGVYIIRFVSGKQKESCKLIYQKCQ
jgi:hypothetical protein